MPLPPRTLLGPYEILAPIGAGGMGEVYKARDTRLDRIVAIKVSQERFSDRFQREARASAALNHPNICQLYDVGPNYLVMEFVDGSPIGRVDNARKLVDLAVQIADGLAAAHAVPIVHRDLKPENILVTADGRVKILDFGLAKVAAATSAAADATQTIVTDPGTTVGTVYYMSPEQARGEATLGPQSDQFSFGLVLYELAAGKRAFQRASAPETMTAIIRDQPDPLPADVPVPLRWVVERLLAKEAAERYESTRDLYRELKQIRERLSQSTGGLQSAAVAPAAHTVKGGLFLAAVAIGCLAFGFAFDRLVSPAPASDLGTYRFTPISWQQAEERSPSWSPDGKSIAYYARVHGIYQVFTQVVGSVEAAQLTRASENCTQPFWSPDGATVYYISGNQLWAVPASGGSPELILQGAGAAAIHPDGKTLAFTRGSEMWIGSAGGGPPKQFSPGPFPGIYHLQFSPDGSTITADDNQSTWLVAYPSGKPKLHIDGDQASSWFPDSRHLLLAAAPAKGSSGSVMTVLDVSDGRRRTVYPARDAHYLSVSPDGKRIAYVAGESEWDVLEISIASGTVHTVISGAGTAFWPDWAPSGTHFLYSAQFGSRGGAIEDRDAAGGGFSRRLIEGDSLTEPQWSPDGTRFVFTEIKGSNSRLMLANASGGHAVMLDQAPPGKLAATGMAWSPDSRWISYVRPEGDRRTMVKILARPSAAPVFLADVNGWSRSVTRWSPTGDWIVYPAADGLRLISPDGKSTHLLTRRKFKAYNFSRDGSEVFGVFQNTPSEGAQWQLYAVSVRTGAERFLAAVDLPLSASTVVGFSIHPDGKRFLTSIAKWPFQIWMLEGFEPPQYKGWLARLTGR